MTPAYFEEKHFQRALKRHIKSQPHRFILKVPPFFKDQAISELNFRNIAKEGSIEATEAGIEFDTTIEGLYAAHALLHTPSRILMEINRFRAGAVEELFKKAVSLPWELYINPRLPVRIHSRIRNSRINHEGAAAETLFSAVSLHFDAPPFREQVTQAGSRDESGDPSQIQRIYLNVEHNQCRIAADTSGEHLHKRGFRQYASGAPIRETLAAGFLFWILDRIEAPGCVLDPMCGSGTFPMEWAQCSSAGSLYSAETSRAFTFEHLPWHRPNTWNFINNQPYEPMLPPVPLFASDIDAGTVELARKNFASAGISDRIHLDCRNFFDLNAAAYPAGTPGLIVANLPYGIRRPEGSGDFFKKFVRHAKDAFPGWTVACIGPENVTRHNSRDHISFFNGGIRVNGVILDI